MFKRVVSAAIYFGFFLSLCSPLTTFSQSNQTSLPSEVISAATLPMDSPLTQLGTEYHNSIELLQNRFRIDYKVDEITMIFFREYGSAPIVLVKPDGSKIFQSSADGENIFWFDSATYDMISIKNPTPGPWQAVGQITPQSRVMVISDLALHVDPLPDIIFSGEILKQTAYLTNNGTPIDYSAFRDVVELDITFASTNNPNFNNFGANTETIATFEDNGKGMDERPLDGTFTGQFNLAIADGEWIPTFTVSTPMYSREQVDPNVMLLSNPIKIEVELDGGGSGYHSLKVDAQREYVDMSTLLLDGKVRFPNGDIQNFSITDMSADVREYLIVNYEYGVYRVKLTAYGNTIDGREFILNVPEYSFLSEEPEPVVVETVTPVNESVDTSDAAAGQQSLQVKPEEEKMSTSTLVSLIVGINLFILLIGGAMIWWFSLDKKPSFKLFNRNKAISEQPSSGSIGNVLSRLFKRKSAAPEVEKEPKVKPEPENGFMDLSLPKD
jgi:uncharacterized protein (TIGR03503 family)